MPEIPFKGIKVAKEGRGLGPDQLIGPEHILDEGVEQPGVASIINHLEQSGCQVLFVNGEFCAKVESVELD